MLAQRKNMKERLNKVPNSSTLLVKIDNGRARDRQGHVRNKVTAVNCGSISLSFSFEHIVESIRNASPLPRIIIRQPN